MLDNIKEYFETIWSDFSVKDNDLYETNINISDIFASETCKLVALSFSTYNAYNNTAYGEGTVDRGITEQEAYDQWSETFQREQRIFKKQLNKFSINTIPQSVYDGLLLYYWSTMKITTVESGEGIYDLKKWIESKNWDKVASIIMRSKINKRFCVRAATILRLADYGSPKDRSWHRTNGIYNMRSQNELGALSADQLVRARFAYYAETLKFLPFTPEAKKRDIAREYEKTKTISTFEYNGSTSTFKLLKEPSMTPVEKLSVTINGNLIQHLYDYTVSGNLLTINKSLEVGDIIFAVIKI
jgi:hypothetical protein